ncbi:MAG: hypothetical protein HKN23_15430 [Verrucomicrobiales bacterium]|nr:hypothetical protein [Verrucomicrobiales bacterium]
MAEETESPEPDQSSGAEDIPAPTPPSINLPPPDKFDVSQGEDLEAVLERNRQIKEENTTVSKKQKRKWRKEKRKLDPGEARDRRRNCCGCLLLFVLFLVVPSVIIPGWIIYKAVSGPAKAGFETVDYTKESGVVTVDEAPGDKTLILASWLIYQAEKTPHELNIVAQDVTVSGIFEKDVVIHGVYVTLEKGTVFRGNVDVNAVEVIDKGASVEGKTGGRVFFQKSAD